MVIYTAYTRRRNIEYADLEAAINCGCTAFLSVGTTLPSGTALAVVFGFERREDCTSSARDTAQSLALLIANDCQDFIEGILAAIALVFTPPPIPKVELSTSDDEENDDFLASDMEWDRNNNNLSITRSKYNKFTLKFKDPCLEAAFAAENNVLLTERDAVGYIFAFSAMISFLFAPRLDFAKQPATTGGVQMWRWISCQVPSCFLLSSRMRPLYYRHREAILCFIFVSAMCVHVKVQASHLSGHADLCMHSFLWLFLLMLFFRMRFRLVLPLTLTFFFVDALLKLPVRSLFSAHVDFLACFPMEALITGALVVAGPLLLLWCAEKNSRVNFLLRLRDN